MMPSNMYMYQAGKHRRACSSSHELSFFALTLLVVVSGSRNTWSTPVLLGSYLLGPRRTTMDPKVRKLIRVTIDEDEPGETADLVERLMGKKPEMRFQYIQENARFVEDVDV